MDSDERLVRRMLKGDEGAIDEFVKKYYPVIFQYCRKRLWEFHLAEDVTQETFEHFFRSLSLYSHHGKMGNYLYTIAGNLCRDLYRAKRPELPADQTDMGIYEEILRKQEKSADDPMADRIAQIDMKNALDRLPEAYREIMILYVLYELKQTEIAAMLNLRLHIVKYRMKKGKMLLEKILREGEYL